MKIFRIIFFALAGLFLAIGLLNISTQGYFEWWKKASFDSQKFSEYFSATDETHYPNGADVKENCNYSSPEFSKFSNSPNNIVDCAQFIVLYPEGTLRYVFARDDDGNIWE